MEAALAAEMAAAEDLADSAAGVPVGVAHLEVGNPAARLTHKQVPVRLAPCSGLAPDRLSTTLTLPTVYFLDGNILASHASQKMA